MDKKLLILFLLIPAFIPIQAQPFHGGILAGFTASQVDGDSYAGFDKAGIQAGVFVSTALSPVIDTRLEIRYTMRGARNNSTPDNTGMYRLTLNYIDLPVLLSVKVKNLGTVEAGLVPGYLFAASGRDDNGRMPNASLAEFKKFDLDTRIGLNIFLTEKIAVNLHYSYSLFSIRDREVENASYTWFGKLFGNEAGNFNNYLVFGLYYTIR
jgi:hypothetical protein